MLLDDFEPGLTTAELRPLFAELRDALVPLVSAAGDAGQQRNDGAFKGEFDAESQRVAVLDVLEALGFDLDRWRLDPTLHPFASGISADDVRLTTRYDEHDFAVALYSALHEFGHGLYEARARARAAAHHARRPGLARRPRVAEPDVGEHHRPLAPVLRVAAPAPERDAARRGRRARHRRRSTAR